MNSKVKKCGFTLIELLIVVAIIAILAAIAIPNFLLAQTRSKISKNKAGLAAGMTAVEAYLIDYNDYPPMRIWTGSMAPFHYQYPQECTTPVAYITKWPTDVFNRYAGGYDNLPIRYSKPGFGFNNGFLFSDTYVYFPTNFENPDPNEINQVTSYQDIPIKYGLWADGPDVLIWTTSVDKQPFYKTSWYDPTNGTVSRGFVVKLQGGLMSQ